MKQSKSKPITYENISNYLELKYGQNSSISKEKYEIIYGINSLLQNDYGLAGDCTITSMTCILNYICRRHVPTIYNVVETNAKKYGYNGDFGTIPFVINNILKKSENDLKLQPQKWRASYIKNFGFNFNTIIKLIQKKHPIILSIYDDGRGCYHNHTVTVIGYSTYLVNKKEQKFLLLYDNWSTKIRYLDYDILNNFCSLNYYV